MFFKIIQNNFLFDRQIQPKPTDLEFTNIETYITFKYTIKITLFNHIGLKIIFNN